MFSSITHTCLLRGPSFIIFHSSSFSFIVQKRSVGLYYVLRLSIENILAFVVFRITFHVSPPICVEVLALVAVSVEITGSAYRHDPCGSSMSTISLNAVGSFGKPNKQQILLCRVLKITRKKKTVVNEIQRERAKSVERSINQNYL